MLADAIGDAIKVKTAYTDPEGYKWVVVDCSDYLDYQALPDALRFSGEVYGRTGWNSDAHECYYSTYAADTLAYPA